MKKTIVVASILLSASPYLAYGWGTGNAGEPSRLPAVSVTKAAIALPLNDDRNHSQTERRGWDASTLAARPYPAIIPTEGR